MIASHPDLVFEGIGISIPGRFDGSRQRVTFAPNLKWPEFDLRGPLEKATGLHSNLKTPPTHACSPKCGLGTLRNLATWWSSQYQKVWGWESLSTGYLLAG